MIKISIFYPNGEGITFDQEYYCNNHLAIVKAKLGDACKKVSVDYGVAGIDGSKAGVQAPFIAIGHLYFESVEAFQAAFVPHANEILNDISNYTNAKPQMQISEVLF